VDENIVYVPGYNYTMSTGNNTGFIYAFNTLTGSKIWSFQGPTDTRFDYNSFLLKGAILYALSAAYLEQDASWHNGTSQCQASSAVLLLLIRQFMSVPTS
jgi:outer membrane protein assembly factor BamB